MNLTPKSLRAAPGAHAPADLATAGVAPHGASSGPRPLPSGVPILTVKDVCKRYDADPDSPLVLDNVNMTVDRREIVALLGRSGSGKSTLLRIIAGLLSSTSGQVSVAGKPVSGPANDVAMVFQSFALFPWLTVLENVQVGLEARGVPPAEMRKRALAAIDLIGLDGFENAYPRELSGGMRQRVGFARALVLDPGILLLDEPFSALDVLTAETVRTDFLDLWGDGHLAIGAVLLVTHNIEEAVQMCDRILVMSSNPGRVAAEIEVTLPHPRVRTDPAFRQLVDHIYGLMTRRRKAAPGIAETLAAGLSLQLPHVSTNVLAGLMEMVDAEPHNGVADLPVISSALQMSTDDLLKVAETLQMLGFAEVVEGDIRLLPPARQFAQAELDVRKRLFADHLLQRIPLASHIRRVLQERPNHRAPRPRFETELEDHMSETAADETLKAMISWARYAEVFAYDGDTAQFHLDAEEEA
ncbi:AAA-associated domain-containing protein [Nitrospirillum viridazoti]|uniref:Nitrate ABC transporter ATP-binding protein n=1 Tax=Nitrospirillum viridazoti CBAmc TaxID=1441467 RepID=A0A248JTV2_9PROT|nr:nitrate/sulfonate/bicarbonate ABC transporter ATP-binding protein [Nitrospirillum amazonense]ASG22029.1 nitrate ABC transporter ATP-binding protein [Nitrospirillum amazonense CBAmc]TWB39817.1 NitT/TauT family transport system ATP-binding protein [Nitrospirillum amazonense]